jgi:transglutaminase-like putative cysteine protease
VKAGFTYTVTSAAPNLSPELLRQAVDPAPASIQRTYTQLDTLPDDLRALAAQIAVGSTPYDKALALQNWFRDNFTYDINVPTGQGTSAIRTFLRNQRGYCEQFAGTFAVFARAVGLPARVAVGFTPGTYDASDGKYHVQGRHAHAWPEVYLTGIGWVPFEPTPERGNPDAANYTGVPAQQVDETPPTTASTGSTTVSPGDLTFPPIDFSQQGPGGGVTGTTATAQSSVPGWLVNFAIVVAIVLILGGGWMIAVPRLTRARWERRRRAATSAAGRAIVAWNEVTTALGRVGVPPLPSETPLEYSHRATRARVTDGRRLVHLAELVTVAAYSLFDVSDDVVAECEADRDTILNGLAARSSRGTRVWRRIDPRPLVAALPGEEAVDRAEPLDSGWSVRAEREAERRHPVS